MKQCWEEKPENRPKFDKLSEMFEKMMLIDNPYLDFGGLDESKAYYNVPSFNSIPDEEEKENDESVDVALSGDTKFDEGEKLSAVFSTDSGTVQLLKEDNCTEYENVKKEKKQQLIEGGERRPVIDSELLEKSLAFEDSVGDRFLSTKRQENKYEFPKELQSSPNDQMEEQAIDFDQLQLHLCRGRNNLVI